MKKLRKNYRKKHLIERFCWSTDIFCIFGMKEIPGVSNGIGDTIAFSTSCRLGFVTN
jgi:hypothetical protein